MGVKFCGIQMAMMMMMMMVMLLPKMGMAGNIHLVGDNKGWRLGVDYHAWAKRNVFRVGDILGILLLYIYTFISMSNINGLSKYKFGFISLD